MMRSEPLVPTRSTTTVRPSMTRVSVLPMNDAHRAPSGAHAESAMPRGCPGSGAADTRFRLKAEATELKLVAAAEAGSAATAVEAAPAADARTPGCAAATASVQT